jgi:hypothetical protein
MLVSATILKFSTGSSSGSTGTLGGSSQSGSGCSGNILTLNPLPWECDKFSPVKLESPDTNLDDIVLDQSASSDFAELKPLPYDDYGSATALTGGMDPVLSAHNNNNNTLNKCLGSPASSLQYSSSCSQSDVTSSGSPTSPPGSSMAAKIEALDFNKNDLDDLASIVGISIDADSTVPNGGTGDCNDVEDLDWIDSIKPLNCDLSLDSLMNGNMNGNQLLLHRNMNMMSNSVISSGGQSYLQMVPLGSTLQTLLQGANSQHMPKITQLQQRPSPQAPPPPYSILQSRLQHGPLAPPPPNSLVSHIIKVDSTYDLLKSQQDSMGNGYLSSSYGSSDSLPHSTQSLSNQVTTSDQGLQRRLNELGGLTKIKKKHGSGVRPKLNSIGSGGSTPGSGGGGDQKKMMHHCQICNRGFLNKSNIKVHMRTHTGEKPFKCEHCSKAFRQKAHLLKHMSIHKRISRD